MTQTKLGYLQRDMLDFINAYGRCSLPRDRDSQRVALSLARRETSCIKQRLGSHI
jgi:hypothetical protein